MYRPHRLTLLLALLAITAGCMSSLAMTASAEAAPAERKAASHRKPVKYCTKVRLPSGRPVLRPKGCIQLCKRSVRKGKQHRVVWVRCNRPVRPPRVAPHISGLLSGSGEGTTAAVPAEVMKSTFAATTIARSSGAAAPGGGTAKTLILYDTTGAYGWMGELYAMSTANLASRFGSWKSMPVANYTAGTLDAYTATIYIGSTYDEPLPDAFLDDAYKTTKPVVWIYDNIWRMASRHVDFQAKYGWQWWQFDTSDVSSVTYKGVKLDRSLLNRGGIMQYAALDPAKVTTLATATRADGTTLPWAVRSGNLTYIGENPFTYTGETDRDLAFVDLLFDALAPATPERHRALIRLEDITPNSDPADLKAVADALYKRRIPFGFGVSPQYRDPKKVQGTTTTLTLAQTPQVVAALKYMQARGGVMINHGFSHQYGSVANPYDGVSGNDFEFYRVTENTDHTLNFAGPVPEDSPAWAKGRMTSANAAFAAAKLTAPKIFEFPHYTSSVNGYDAAKAMYPTRWERALYFSGVMKGGAVDYARPIGQRFPFVVRDVYGSAVLPENIGSYEPEAFYQFPIHPVADILNGADKNKVVRDGFASFYFHPFWGPGPLEQALDGLTARGWTFVSPTSLS
ncbi:MAG: ydaL-like uncharacterized protein [Thermoleophilia bacterium]|nr:ydaL-like uncharacterized protein [Thermoleophilia bacterium]